MYYLLILPKQNKIFSKVEIAGTMIKKYAKQNTVQFTPNWINGTSTCNCPKLPNNIKLNTNNQKKNLDKGLNANPLYKLLSVIGNTNNINKAPNIAITPPSLSGIERKIAQNGNKYHSGTIEAGVTIGLPGI